LNLSCVRIGILTGGGDAPGLNAAIRAVARRAFQLGHRVSGVKNGWAGCLEEGLIDELMPADVRGILPMGGTILGTSRTNPAKEKDGIARVMKTLRHHGVDALVPIGGDDTLTVAAKLAEAGFPTVGVPKTIDNDLSVTEFCIGFDTAVGVVTEALDRLHTTASAHHRVMVVEVELIVDGKSGVIPVRRNGDIEVVPLTDVIKEQRRVPKELYELTQVFV